MSDTEDNFLNSSRPLLRAFSIQSYEGEENGATSQNLLEDLTERGARGANPAHDEDQVTISLMRGVKRTMDSLVTEVKKLEDQNIVLDKKMNSVLHKNDNLEKLMKEMVSKNNKSVEPLESLLTSDGLKMLKMMCFRNLDSTATDKDDMEMLNKFMTKAKDDGWLLKQSGKAEKDIVHQYRLKRNYLRSQIRARVFEDMANKTAEDATDLPKTERFVREHLSVSQLNDDCMRILYNFSYTHLRYLNKKVALLSESEKEVAKNAKEDPCKYVMRRVMNDRDCGRDYTVIKERFSALLVSFSGFEPPVIVPMGGRYIFRCLL